MTLPKDILVFLERFPNKATSWSKATDEVREIAKFARELISDMDGVDVEPVDFTKIKLPSEWNTRAKAFITKVYGMMHETTRITFVDHVRKRYGVR